MRHAYRTIAKASRHRLNLDPADELTFVILLEKIEPNGKSKRVLPLNSLLRLNSTLINLCKRSMILYSLTLQQSWIRKGLPFSLGLKVGGR